MQRNSTPTVNELKIKLGILELWGDKSTPCTTMPTRLEFTMENAFRSKASLASFSEPSESLRFLQRSLAVFIELELLFKSQLSLPFFPVDRTITPTHSQDYIVFYQASAVHLTKKHTSSFQKKHPGQLISPNLVTLISSWLQSHNRNTHMISVLVKV